MRRFLGLVLILLGAAAVALPHLPIAVRDQLPSQLPDRSHHREWPIGGGVAIALGVLLIAIPRRRKGPAIADNPVRKLCARRGFSFTEFPDGWQARGDWNGETITVRWDSGYHAGRFGRQYVVVLTVPGEPIEPLPLRHDQVVLAERHADRFDVILLEAGVAGKQDRVAERIDEVLSARR